MSQMSCAKCKRPLPDDVLSQARAPCPDCGALSRSYLETLTDGIAFYDGHRVRAKNLALPSAKKLRFDTYSSVEPSHKYGKLVRVHRTIDPDKDWYSEKVIDLQSGEILHECEEPLSQHVGHGTAKTKSEP